jgi:hypothetical protein
MPIHLLMRLQQVQLPVRVADPEEVRKVSKLLATGLIQAEFEAIRARAGQATWHVATVTRITEEGRAELAAAGYMRQPTKALVRPHRRLRVL